MAGRLDHRRVRALAIAAVVALAASGWGAVAGSPIPLSLTLPGKPGTEGKLDGPGAVVCYNLTLSDAAVREVVWWEKGRLALRLEPCVGKPHLRASVYGCPSEGARSVWEYMSPKMRADLVAQVLGPRSLVPSRLNLRVSSRHVLPHWGADELCTCSIRQHFISIKVVGRTAPLSFGIA